ncbi:MULTISPECIES: GNAT family N-acetyltransferase [unclassified Leptolyngbya]|uniref:GNAT family N-acetyltransferase n=1 Tax=unclassified Leptolyngbya TaxID=2650499 RepID=UPI001685460B|nr:MULTISPECIES: GNAT family N-acetyltransferase [unclassified Leptolyngbya]MBD1912364.1 GNAT family N-acetyltransferase [Leptolyngbya sp. FACHB-8]MBD2158000.1 GNAT family N-acetyltransferase [Leptolyngbya sp. FACHB-16]
MDYTVDPELSQPFLQKGHRQGVDLDVSIYLRPATAEDARLLWQWTNDPHVRAVSFSTSPIPWENHTRWLQQKLTEPGCYLWIASHNGNSIGQVRFDTVCSGEANISISLAPEMRGYGYGKLSLKTACYQVFQETDIHTIHAYIRVDNLVSIRAFEAANFIQSGQLTIQGCEAFHYRCLKP